MNIQTVDQTLSPPLIIIVIAAYNEAQVINSVIKNLYENLASVTVNKKNHFNYKILVIDDCSTDDTATQALQAGAIVLNHPLNLGQGAALQTGFDWILQNHPDFSAAITYDADGQFEASEIVSVVTPVLLGEYEIVLGSRFLGKVENLPLSRQIVLQMGILFTRIFSDLQLTDVHNGFKALSPKALAQIHLSHNRMAHASEILDQISWSKLSYCEVPVTVKYSSYSLEKGQKSFSGSLKIISDLILTKFS